MQAVLWGRDRMQEYQLLQNQMVQPLQHALHQHEVEQEGYVATIGALYSWSNSREKESEELLKFASKCQRHQIILF